MIFRFNKSASKTLDFYRIPDLVLNKEDKYEGDYEQIKEMGFLDIFLEFYNKKDDFKIKNNLMNYNFVKPFSIFSLIDFNELFKNSDIDNIKKIILQKSDSDIRKIILRKIISEKEDIKYYLENPLEIFALIDEIRVDDETKLRLTKAISKPTEALKEYLDILFSFREDFEEIYSKYQDKLLEKAIKYERKLNESGESYLMENLLGLVEGEIFNNNNNKREVVLVVSMLHSLGMSINEKEGLLILGLNFDKTLKIKKEIEKESILKRINLFKILGDETRYKIIDLINNGIGTNKELAKECGISESAVIYHLNRMMVLDMVIMKKNKYKLNNDKVIEMLNSFINDVKKS